METTNKTPGSVNTETATMLDRRLAAAVQALQLGPFEMAAFTADPSAALRLGAAVGYKVAMEDAIKRVDQQSNPYPGA